MVGMRNANSRKTCPRSGEICGKKVRPLMTTPMTRTAASKLARVGAVVEIMSVDFAAVAPGLRIGGLNVHVVSARRPELESEIGTTTAPLCGETVTANCAN